MQNNIYALSQDMSTYLDFKVVRGIDYKCIAMNGEAIAYMPITFCHPDEASAY